MPFKLERENKSIDSQIPEISILQVQFYSSGTNTYQNLRVNMVQVNSLVEYWQQVTDLPHH